MTCWCDALPPLPLALVGDRSPCFSGCRCPQAGRKEPNTEIGRYLAETVAALPYVSPQEFDKLFEDNMQDMLLLMYLSSLMRTQIAIADKLGTQLLPIL